MGTSPLGGWEEGCCEGGGGKLGSAAASGGSATAPSSVAQSGEGGCHGDERAGGDAGVVLLARPCHHWETDGQRSALRRLLKQPLLLAQGGAAQVLQHLTDTSDLSDSRF